MTEATEDPPAPPDPLPEPEPDLVAMLRAVNRAFGVAEVGLLCLFLCTLIGVACFNLIANHLLSYNPTWTDELIRYSVFFVAWTGATLAAQTDQMLNMDVITRLVRPRTKLAIRLGTGAFTLVACGLLTWGGFRVRSTVAGEDYEILSKGIVALAFPVGSIVVGMHVVLHMAIDAIYLGLGRVPPAIGQQPLH